MICERCNGAGSLPVATISCGIAGCIAGHGDAPCPECDGVGVLTDQRIDLLNLGAQMRKLRNGRDEPLRACARRIGISAPELSDAEHARLPMERAKAIYALVEGQGWMP